VAMNFLADLTAVDYFGREPRFEVVYHLRSFKTGARLRVKALVAEPEDGSVPACDSVVSVWASANWMEREVWDLYGIKFRGHPDLRRILMYEEFVGHPLRKDYPKEKRQPLVRRPPDEVERKAMAETRKMPLGIQDVEDLDHSEDPDPMPTEPMTLNM